MVEVKQDISNLEEDMTSLKLHIENVADKNIQSVAEGHLDLSRNLHEVLKSEREEELLIIRVRMLEDEVKDIKKKLDKTA